MPSLGQHIVIARAKKRWKQQQLADAAHISQKYLSQIEHDHVDPRWKILVKLALALEPYLHLDMVAFDTEQDLQVDTPHASCYAAAHTHTGEGETHGQAV